MGAFVLLGIIGWLVLTIWVVRCIVKLIKRPHIFVVLWPVLFFAPVADELIGQFQYKQYCKEAEEIKIYGTVPAGLELYTVEGKWRLSSITDLGWRFIPPEERKPLEAIVDSKIRWDNSIDCEASSIIAINCRDTKIREVKTGRLLANIRSYSTRGGLLSQALFERGGFFVQPQCYPNILLGKKITDGYQLHTTLMPFEKTN